MLVLSRKLGQSIRIGEDVEVFVVGVQGQNVRLGFRAPKEVRIMRAELIEFESQDETLTTNEFPSFPTVTAECVAH